MAVLTPDARHARRRAAIAAGSFKVGAGAVFANTASLDLELLSGAAAAGAQQAGTFS